MSIINGLWKSASVGAKLLGAIGALFIATVLLVMSTFAWFTISKTPQASKINVNVANTKNFEIAKAKNDKTTQPAEVTENDKDDQYAWGANISFGDDSNPIAVELPVKVTSDGKIQTVSFDDGTDGTGRTAGLVDVTEPGTLENGVTYYTYKDSNGTEKKCAAVMGMWLRTNTTGEISATMENMTVSGGNSEFNKDAIGVAIRIGNNGFKALDQGTTGTQLGTLNASKDGTYTELIVYLNGDTSDGQKGVVAYDVGGNDPIKVAIESIKFTNSNIDANATN